MMTSIKRNELNLRKKIQLAEKDNIFKTQVASILKRKAEYLAAFEENRQGDRKRHCNSNECNIIDTAMWDWFQCARSMNIHISGLIVQEKALEFATSLDINEFNSAKATRNLTNAKVLEALISAVVN